MAQQMYRVVETSWKANGRVESDIGCEWKPEKKAKDELRVLTQAHPGRQYSLQKKPS